MTGKEMCETIVRALKDIDPNVSVTPLEIWESDPSGGIAHVFRMHKQAISHLHHAGIATKAEEACWQSYQAEWERWQAMTEEEREADLERQATEAGMVTIRPGQRWT